MKGVKVVHHVTSVDLSLANILSKKEYRLKFIQIIKIVLAYLPHMCLFFSEAEFKKKEATL